MMSEAGIRVLALTVSADRSGQTVKSLLLHEFHMAPSLISRIKLQPGGITVNGLSAHTDLRVRAGDVVAAQVSDIGGVNPAPPVKTELEILWEDEDLAVLNKPAGMAVHGGEGGATVANALAYLWGADQAFHPVSRLDKGTSGLMIAAKSGYIHDRLRRMLHTDGFIRRYIAFAQGEDLPSEGVIELPISPQSVCGTKRAVDEAGLPSRTEFKVLASGGGLTELLVTPRTGRTHQIRLHFSATGHPLAGDALYGGDCGLISRPALHSAKIELVHPITGALIRVSAPLPPDMAALERRL